jgi:hypothetical protein
VFIYASGAERAAEEVDAGDIIAIDGRLGWKLGLCVSCFSVEVLAKAAVQSLQGTSDPELRQLVSKLIMQAELADGTLKDPTVLRR